MQREIGVGDASHSSFLGKAPIGFFSTLPRYRLPVAAQVVARVGSARSGKTYQLVRQYRTALSSSSPAGRDRALWLAPNARTSADVRECLVRAGLDACFRPGVLTFDDLTAQILTAANVRAKAMDAVMQRELLRRVIDLAQSAGTLTFFADAARRSGFVDLVAEHIAELKRRAIQPEAYRAALARRAADEQHGELAQLYTDYENLLTKHGLIDRESAQFAARNALANHGCQRFEDLELVIADGFTDFTSSQYATLRALSRRAKQIVITLPAEAAGPVHTGRHDLFSKTTATLRELREYFKNLDVRTVEARPLPCPAIDHATQQIFRNPAQVPAPSASALESLSRIEIVEAAGAQDEIVQIARRVKSLLASLPLPCREGPGEGSINNPTAKTNPQDILVVFRSLADAAPRVREVFDRFGIPYYLDATTPIISAPFIKTLLDLLQLDLDDWPFRRVIAVLTNNTIGAFDDGSRRAADWLVRDLQIASGRASLVERTEALAAEPSKPTDRSEHLQRRVDAATSALPALSTLANTLKQLPNKATPAQWCDALSQLSTTLELSRADDDLAAWQSVVKNFAALARLDAWLGQPPQERSRRDLLRALRDVATNVSLPRTTSEAGRVRVLSATAARNISARHVFLAGMSEQAFPAAERAGRLASDADYRHLAESAHEQHPATTSAATRGHAEMLLFYEVLSRAEESLTISYPALDDKAQTLPPSPYVIELERLFRNNDAKQSIRRTTPQLSPIAPSSTTSSISDWRLQAVARAVDKDADRRLLAGIFAHNETESLAATIDAGLRIVHARARGESFGPAEGLLASPAIAARLAQRFGPKHAWSASQWETYAACPFRFFMQEVLGLEPLGDLVLETDFARRGSRLHDVLAAFHREWLTVRGEKEIAMSADEEAEAFLAHLQDVTTRRTATNRVGVDAALVELDRRQILKWANRHFDNQSKYKSGCEKLGVPMTPAHFEFRFGAARRGESADDPNSTTDSFVINVDGEPIHIMGQIDRIDVGTLDGKTVFNVIDYKSGRRATLKREQLETGQQLQLPIYVEAAQVLVFKNDATPMQAGYWGMESGFDAKGALAARHDDQSGGGWTKTQETVRRIIREFIDHIRHGDFPVASRDDKCTSTCDYRMTCRVSQARSLKKTWWPEGEM